MGNVKSTPAPSKREADRFPAQLRDSQVRETKSTQTARIPSEISGESEPEPESSTGTPAQEEPPHMRDARLAHEREMLRRFQQQQIR